MWCITKMVNVYKFHKQLAVTLWTLFKQVKINPPKTGVREPAPGCSYPRWPLSRISSSHDVQKHWAIILGYSQHDGWGRPCAPSVASAAISQKENAAPVHSLHSFLMEMTAPCTHTHRQCVVGTGQDCVPQRGGLTSENAPIHRRERLLMRKPGALAKSFFFFLLFKAICPELLNQQAPTEWRKQMLHAQGLREVRAEGNAFRNALRQV